MREERRTGERSGRPPQAPNLTRSAVCDKCTPGVSGYNGCEFRLREIGGRKAVGAPRAGEGRAMRSHDFA